MVNCEYVPYVSFLKLPCRLIMFFKLFEISHGKFNQVNKPLHHVLLLWAVTEQ